MGVSGVSVWRFYAGIKNCRNIKKNVVTVTSTQSRIWEVGLQTIGKLKQKRKELLDDIG